MLFRSVYKSLEELARILNQIDANPALALSKGREGTEGLAEFSPKKHLEDYLKFIANALQP